MAGEKTLIRWAAGWWTALTTPTGALRAWWAIAAGIVSILLAVGLSIGYTVHAQRVNDQRFCTFLRAYDVPLPTSPPPTAQQRDRAAKLHALRLALGCR